MKHSPFKIFLLVLVVVLLLLPLHWLPQMQIGSYEVKSISIVRDIVNADNTAANPLQDSIPSSLALKPTAKDSCPKGLVCIDDYSDAQPNGMTSFYEALCNVNQLDRPVRIAYLGDSFIEVDILTSSLRRLLQAHYGGAGVGFLDMAPPYAANRATVKQHGAGWTDHCVLKKGSYDKTNLTISQHYFTAAPGAWTEINGIAQPHLDTTEVHTLYLRSHQPTLFGIKLNNGPMYALRSAGTGRVESISHTARAGRTRWQLQNGTSNATFYGVAEESKHGVIVDNFSLRGSSGTTLTEVSIAHLQELQAVRPYDLIVLQYGLNVASKKQTDYSNYTAHMKRVIEQFKQAFPSTSILLVGVGDREDRLTDGQIHTLPGIVALSRYQQTLASDCGIAFWNLYQAMGGEGSIKRMAEAHPAEAGKDYTHINQKGGDRIAAILYKTLVYGQQQHQRRQSAASTDQ